MVYAISTKIIDGETITEFSDGRKLIEDDNGNWKIIFPGWASYIKSGSTVTCIFNDGTKKTFYENGSCMIQRSDNSCITDDQLNDVTCEEIKRKYEFLNSKNHQKETYFGEDEEVKIYRG